MGAGDRGEGGILGGSDEGGGAEGGVPIRLGLSRTTLCPWIDKGDEEGAADCGRLSLYWGGGELPRPFDALRSLLLRSL